MKIKSFLLICFLILSKITSAQVGEQKKEKIVTYLENLTDSEFNGVILLAEKDSVFYENAYGFANLEYGVKNKVTTLFNVASITKTMTAVGALKLVDEGLLDLDDTVGTYLPNFSNQTVRDSVTPYQLLTHTSGLNNFLVDDYKDMGKLHLKTLNDYLPLFAYKSLLFSPGSKYAYSGAGYVVLGLLIENLSGEPYHSYMKNQVFKSAGMNNTIAIPIDSIVQNKASGYTSYFGESDHLSKNDSYLGYANPAGFYYATAEDLYRFFRALKNYRLISESLTKQMMSPLVNGYYTNYGFGISVDKRWEQTIFGHSGGWFGVQCELMYFERDEITAVLLSNIDTAEGKGMNYLSNYLKHILANKTIPKFK